MDADKIGMLATVMNALAVKDALRQQGVDAVVMTSSFMPQVAECFTSDKAIAALESGKIVVFGGGTGNPFFTTDTGAALRAAELDADAIFKGTTVEGVYDSDPRTNPNAKLLKDVSYAEAVEKRLHVMDTTAFVLCQEQRVPEIRVFSMENLDNILKVADGEPIGTRVHE